MKKNKFRSNKALSRREMLTGMAGLGALSMVPPAFAQAAQAAAAQAAANGKVLVILELSGGNDGLNTVVPYGDDAYYRQRPNIGIPKNELRVIDDHFGFNPEWQGSNACTKTGRWQLCTAAAMKTLPTLISPLWPTGIQPHPIVATSMAG